MKDTSSPDQGRSSEGHILPSLIFIRGATQPPLIITGLLLINIGLAFNHPIGLISQIRTLRSTVTVIFSLLMGTLSIRFKHKSLLMMGLVFFSISAWGSFIAPNFSFLLLTYSLSGIGMAMVPPMCSTLVGEHLPLQKRSNAIGWILAGGALSYLIGSPAVSYIAGLGGWRMAFIGFMLPISLLSLIIAFFGIPSTQNSYHVRTREVNYIDGLKEILSNRSAIASLIGSLLGMAIWEANQFFSISFFRQRFLVTTGWASILLSGMAMCFIVGSLTSGYLTNRYGRKNLTVFSTIFLGVFSIIYPNIQILWLSILFVLLICVFAGMRYAASESLSLEQVPIFRGTMMSITFAAGAMGSALGSGIGGLVLLWYDYEILGICLGIIGIAAIIFYLSTIDTAKTSFR